MRFAFSIMVVALIFAGCGSGDSTDAGETAGVELTYHRFGGLPGIDQTLRIHRDGTLDAAHYPVGDGERSATRFRLGAAQAERLRTALEESGFDDLTLTESGVHCVDCLVYELATPANQLRFDQVTAPPAMEPVLAQLDAIVDAHLPAGALPPDAAGLGAAGA
jgi:hypothetical protein